MRYGLGVSDHTMIAHSFPGRPFFGPAQGLHGATFAVELEVEVDRLGPQEVVMDIGALAQVLREVLADLDYRNLDEHPAFEGRLSTTERVAEHVLEQAAERLAALPEEQAPPRPATLRVVVRESPRAHATVTRPL